MADESQKHVKVWRATKKSPAGVQVEEKTAYLIGNRDNFVAASDTGVVISGGKGITFNTSSENIRKGGLFIEMNDFVQMIPTSVVTPMPGQIPFPPLALISSVMKDMPFFMALMNNV